MKVLNNDQLQIVGGGFGNFFAGAFAGWAVGKFGFDPAFDAFIKSAEKQIPDTLDRMNDSINKNGPVGRYDLN
ncbi:TPA: hypothetical protein ACU21L_000421 [Mannheimia haemolytica]